jgi:hypothetical protein
MTSVIKGTTPQRALQPHKLNPAVVEAGVNEFSPVTPRHSVAISYWASRIYPEASSLYKSVQPRRLPALRIMVIPWSSCMQLYVVCFTFGCNGRHRRLPRRSQKAEVEKTQRPRKRKGKTEKREHRRRGLVHLEKKKNTNRLTLVVCVFSSRSAQRLRDQFRPSGLPACLLLWVIEFFYYIQSNHSSINQSVNHVGSKRTQEAPQGAHESTRKSSLCRLSRTSTAMGLVDCSTAGRSTRVAPHWRLHVLGMLGGASSIGCAHFICSQYQSRFL